MDVLWVPITLLLAFSHTAADDKCINATCSQKCRSSPHGPECYCNDGYKLNASDNRTCTDIDECAKDGFCSQQCTNLLGSYKCSCLEGYNLENNNTCIASGSEPVLLISSIKEIQALYLRSERHFTVHEAFSKAARVVADPLSSRVYWAEISSRSSIYSSDIDGSRLETILQTGLMLPEDIAVDYIGRNLYITDSGLKQLLVCKMDGSMCHVLHDKDVHNPRAIALDVSGGFVYWSDWDNVSVGIYSSGMDGSQRVTLVSQDIKWPNGIAIDFSTNRLYWTDAKFGTIEYITLDGKTRRMVLKSDNSHPYSLAVFEDTLYWSDWNTLSLNSCNKFSGHEVKVLRREKTHLMGVHVYHPVLAKRSTDGNPCLNNSCSHMCLLAPLNNYTCACPPSFKLSYDGRRCEVDDTYPMLWVNDETKIYHIRPQSVGSTSLDELPISLIERIGKMAYDWESRALYISDTKKPAIYSVNLTTMETKELVRDHLVNLVDLAYDWLNRNLYWLDSRQETVEVVSIGTLRRAIVLNLSKPTAIALLPSAGRMFISVIGIDTSVAMYDLDGKNRKVLIGSSSLVVALAVHPTLSHLYFVDGGDKISIVNYMSLARNSSMRPTGYTSIASIAVEEKFVYWTQFIGKFTLYYENEDRRLSFRIDLPDDYEESFSRNVLYAYEPPKNLLGHGNCEMNGGCSYLCLGSPNGRTCVCPINMTISQDGQTCTTEPGSCPGDDFRCTNGRCILMTWKCNHRDDCGDGSDEVGCPPPTSCGKDQYRCTDAECIPLLWRCDGENDCNDHSDETACNSTSCNPETQLRCDHGQCIPRSWACDGTNDCFDGTDERNCSYATVCRNNYFKCDDGICIDKSLVCNQKSDCKDGSDEKNCTRETCKAGHYQCADGVTCIYDFEVCDGFNDCPDGYEEENCTRKESDCSDDQYFCTNNSRCISKRWLCDGDNDCGDAADENPDTCAANRCKEFFCRQSRECIPLSKRCDGVSDCKDMTDEGGSCSYAEVNCSQVHESTPQGPKCSCYPGFSLLADNVTCEDLDECSIPGSCSQFCSNTEGGFKCSCAEGYSLEQHSKCKADGGPATLAYLLRDQIRGIDLGTHAQRVYVSREDRRSDMKGMTFDAETGFFFFTDFKEETIYSYNPNNDTSEVLLTVSDSPIFLRWDWIAKNLYFTNAEGSIVVCTRDGKYCNTLVQEAETLVQSFDIAPSTGVMFWSVWENGRNRNGIIVRADMDGSRQTTIVRERVVWPNSVTVDHIMEMVYWVDARANVMECANFHGLQRRVVVSDGAHYPFAMAMFEDFVYWSDWGMDTIMKCNKHNGRECKALLETNAKSEMFVVVHASNQPKGVNKCNSSECSHLCLPTRTSFSCMCDRNYQMLNGACVRATDIMPETTTPKSPCVPDPCENGARCEEQENAYICLCPEGYTGDYCEKQEALSYYYYYYSNVGIILVIITPSLIALVVYGRMKRSRTKRPHDLQKVAVVVYSAKCKNSVDTSSLS